MAMFAALVLFALSVVSPVTVAQPSPPYQLIRDYSGQTFFNGWDFFGSYDNLTWGNVTYVTEQVATSQKLAYVEDSGRVIIKVDNTTTVASGDLRNSVRITTQTSYSLGSLWLFDVTHLPWGCSVWPAYWTKGPVWPDNGEIDIIEGVNLQQTNGAELHTSPGCTHPLTVNTSQELGVPSVVDCSTPNGCTVAESKPDSFGPLFNNASGGVWATSFDATGIFIWFWSRPNVPASVTALTSTSPLTDISDWGTPSMAFTSATCEIPKFFTPQQVVIDITLCGGWAGIPGVYTADCGTTGPTGICYNDSVVGAGSKFDQAYFEINFLRAYTNNASVIASISASPSSTAYGQGAATSSSEASATVTAKSAAPRNGWQVSHGTLLSVGMVLVGLLVSGELVW
ncbi:glycoside hydrolase family 16 protein [Jaapia argillacea MUCL 33604]|uniref:Glycoside hydrolase family 16 protein n=1 Tax=Jaapia argillacea MUCL 33604 TaxID=933084 RepID=A0A067QCF7_9AGAM|nr:glycoside hydrolase family 16 protein [Jaapia argillacea MUCL 33604]